MKKKIYFYSKTKQKKIFYNKIQTIFLKEKKN